MAESTLNIVFQYDEHNLSESRKMFQNYGLLELFERMPGLIESLRREVEQHVGIVPDALARADENGDLHHRWDMILRILDAPKAAVAVETDGPARSSWASACDHGPLGR